MSEDTHDVISDDAAMNNSELESSAVHQTHESQPVRSVMSSEEFEEKLTDFFTKHKKTKLNLVSRIAFEFKGKEALVLEHLHNKYVLGFAAEKPQKKVTQQSEDHHEAQPKHIEVAETKKPKSKKKLIMVIIIVLVLAALGGTGFMMKDKLMAMVGMGHPAEHGPEKAEGAGHEEPKKEVIAPKVEAVDSTQTTTVDSTNTAAAADSTTTH